MASVQLKDFLISFMPFERESIVSVFISPTFICTSKGSEIQRVLILARSLHSEFSQF